MKEIAKSEDRAFLTNMNTLIEVSDTCITIFASAEKNDWIVLHKLEFMEIYKELKRLNILKEE